MNERDFFDERAETKTHNLICPHCNQPADYELNWMVRRKRAQLPRGADDRDRAMFAKAQSYMVRKDDIVGCKNIRCRKRFDVAGIQSVAYLQETTAPPAHGTASDRESRIRAAFGRRNLG
jgi:hypothetical protein